MRIVPKLVSALMIGGLFGVASVAFAFSSSNFFPADNADFPVAGHNSAQAVQLNATSLGDGGEISYPVGATPLTLSQITNLSTEYKFDTGSCSGGSPRFVIVLENPIPNGPTKSISLYFGSGSYPSFSCVAGVWTNTGNLFTTGKEVDDSDLGGIPNDTYAHALATYGGYNVIGVLIVLANGFVPVSSNQAVIIDNTLINSTLYTYETATTISPTEKTQCKDGGWENYTRADGTKFKNQGDCIQYINTGK